jgi:hypothetical protein
VAADGDAGRDIFLRDLAAGSTTLADVAGDGAKSNGSNHLAALSPDGGFVAFETTASNLGVSALGWQIYLRALGGNGAGGAPGPGPGPGPGSGGAGPTAPAKASFAGSKRSIKVSKKGAFSFRFRAGPGLTGRVVFASAKKVRVSAKRKKVTLVRKAFTVPPSGDVELRLKLSRKNLRTLRKNRKIRTNVTVTLTNAGGLASTAHTTVTLKT